MKRSKVSHTIASALVLMLMVGFVPAFAAEEDIFASFVPV